MKHGVVSALLARWGLYKPDECPKHDHEPSPVRRAVDENLRANSRSQQKSRDDEDYFRRQRAAVAGVLERLGTHNGGG